MMYPFAISFDGRENPREAVAHVLRQTSVGRDLFAIGWNAAMQFQKSAAFSQSSDACQCNFPRPGHHCLLG